MIARAFGSPRGAVRLALSYPQSLAVRRVDLRLARRLVFVCHGNICRSAYAEAIAHQAGVNAASFGLSTTSGQPAHPPVVNAARGRGLDLAGHRATAAADYVWQEGDVLLAMEVRHLGQIARSSAHNSALSTAPRTLLGLWARVPHIHDPYLLPDAYLETCLDRIDRAMARLIREFNAAQSS